MIIETWLEPMKSMLVTGVQLKDWQLLSSFERSISGIADDKLRSQPLQAKSLLASEYGMVDVEKKLGGLGRSPLVQALIQFICGYHNLDYRDVAHVGHGRMIIQHGSQLQQKIWVPKFTAGSLVGIAATEAHGGSNIQTIRTTARKNGSKYFLNGEKVCISRIKEAAVFVVFFKFEKDETLSAALIDFSRKGVSTETWEPMGLRGWSWGKVVFENTPLTETEVLGARGQGIAIFKEHFVYYRPMVAMTALGVAAAVLDRTMDHINKRRTRRDITEPRDACLESIGHHYAAVNAGILSALCAVVQNIESSPNSSRWSRATKAWSVEQAYHAVSELALLIGATAFRNDHFVAKALSDLRGFLFADGIHDGLRRSVGRTLLDTST